MSSNFMLLDTKLRVKLYSHVHHSSLHSQYYFWHYSVPIHVFTSFVALFSTNFILLPYMTSHEPLENLSRISLGISIKKRQIFKRQ